MDCATRCRPMTGRLPGLAATPVSAGAGPFRPYVAVSLAEMLGKSQEMFLTLAGDASRLCCRSAKSCDSRSLTHVGTWKQRRICGSRTGQSTIPAAPRPSCPLVPACRAGWPGCVGFSLIHHPDRGDPERWVGASPVDLDPPRCEPK